MPKTKKPRKAFDPGRWRKMPRMMPLADLKEIKAAYRNVEIAGTIIQKALDADPIRVAELWIATEMSDDMPAKASEGLKWLDRKLQEIHRFRRPR